MNMIVSSNRKSQGYVGTVFSRDDESLKLVRATVKAVNSALNRDYYYYVKLHGRAPRVKLPSWNREVPLDVATRFDVYVYSRRKDF